MGFFVPLILGGIAFIGLPWLIHRIRRPTRVTVPFSSLMFVPKSDPPVRERKKIEHPWLMLARMFMLLLLAFAFARPFVLRPAAAVGGDRQARQHVILVDTSLSTNAGAGFDAVRDAALACLEGISSDDGVAVVAFQEAPVVLAPLAGEGEGGSGGKARARAALDSLKPTAGATRFVAALQLAEQLLRPPDAETNDNDGETERIIHLVSDLQRTGLPEDQAGYTLGRGVSLKLAPVGLPAGGNSTVEAIALEARLPATLYVRVRLRNYGNDVLQGLLQVWVGGAMGAEEPVTLPAESNTVVPVALEIPLTEAVAGEVRLIGNDLLSADNARYFVYQPEPLRDIGVLLDPDADRSQPVRFLDAALADSQPLPWKLVPVAAEALLAAEMDGLPEVVIVPEIAAMTDDLAAALAAYVEQGGRLLLIPSTDGFPAALAEALLAPSGVTPGAPWKARIEPGAFALLSWIDFEHPVFQPFRAAAYSDFSMVRFNNYFSVAVGESAPVQVVARLNADGHSEGDPASLYLERGAGRLAIWAFPLDPAWTNVTRTRRFVPLLHETVAQLLPALLAQREHTVGEAAYAPPVLASAENTLRWQAPGAETPQAFASSGAHPVWGAPGVVRWFAKGSTPVSLSEPVNLAPTESDLRVFSPEEFLLRVGAVSRDTTEATAVAPEIPQDTVHWEYGYGVLAALAAAGLLEWTLAIRYSHSASMERHVP